MPTSPAYRRVCGGSGLQLQVLGCSPEQKPHLLQQHFQSGQEGTSAALLPQAVEASWARELGPHLLLQMCGGERPMLQHQRVARKLLSVGVSLPTTTDTYTSRTPLNQHTHFLSRSPQAGGCGALSRKRIPALRLGPTPNQRTVTGILRLVLKNKHEFETNGNSRLEKIDTGLLAILPSAAPEEKKRIKKAVKNRMIEKKLLIYGNFFSLICLHRDLVKNPVAAVMAPLKDGLCSINKVYEALIDGDVDPITGQCTNYKQSRKQIVKAKKSLEQSEKAASKGLRRLDQNIETLTQDEGKREQKIRDKKETIDRLRIKQTSNETLLKQSEDSLEVARGSLDSAKSTLQEQEDRKRNAEIITGVGVGLMVIPIIGWIAGPAMAIGGAIELSYAQAAVQEAEEEVQNCKYQMKKYKSKVSGYKSKISQNERDMKKTHDRVEEIHKEIQQVKEKREAVADFQKNVRKVVHTLSGLSGKAGVAECQTRRFILPEPVMTVMEDLMKAAGDIAGDQLLSNKEIPKLLSAIKENSRKLAAISASSGSAEDESYY
ncbi:hypothetical protein NFI96_024820 [Prochilodus magdalenae]|nr:hypothetical protein NFI96_024820 [Prochilodus magdalenae]